MDLSFDGSAYASPRGASALLKVIGINFFRVAKCSSNDDVVLFTSKAWNTEWADLYRENEIKEFDLRHYGEVVFTNQPITK